MSRCTCSWIRRESVAPQCSVFSVGSVFNGGKLVGAVVDRELVHVLVLDVLQVRLAEVEHARRPPAAGCRAARASSPRRGSGRRARRSRSAPRARRPARCSPRRRPTARPCAGPCARGPRAPPGHAWSRSARCAATAASAASRARANEKKNASPCVSISVPPLLAEALADDAAVRRHDVAVVVAELLQQPRRALDVGEGERDGSAGKAHAASIVTG